MLAKVTVKLKTGLLDAQGKVVKGALEGLGFKGISEVRIGKYIEIDLHGLAAPAAKAALERMCRQVLTNPVIETYHVEIESSAAKPIAGKSKKTARRRVLKASARRVKVRK